MVRRLPVQAFAAQQAARGRGCEVFGAPARSVESFGVRVALGLWVTKTKKIGLALPVSGSRNVKTYLPWIRAKES